MTWSPLAPPCPCETPKTRWRTVPWTGGTGLDLGCGREKLFDTEFVIGLDDGREGPIQANLKADVFKDLPFATGVYDYAYSSFVLQQAPYKDVPQILREWMRVIKVGACLILYLPDEEQFPKCNEPEREIAAEAGNDTKQAWNVNYDRVIVAVARTAWNWDLCHFERCDKNDEYALFFVFRKLR